MSDQPQDTHLSEESGGGGIQRYFVIGFVALAAIIALSLVAALVVAATAPEGGVATGFQVVRDFLLIVLALQGIFVSIAIVILILQFSALLNVLKTEVKPLIDELRETSSTARGTAQFVSKNLASPVIKVVATAAGVRAFISEVAGIRRNIAHRD
jgi:hypothetical protein